LGNIGLEGILMVKINFEENVDGEWRSVAGW
jgi:hypothetical protein